MSVDKKQQQQNTASHILGGSSTTTNSSSNKDSLLTSNHSNAPATFAMGVFGRSGGGKNRFVTAMLAKKLNPNVQKKLANIYNVLEKKPEVFIYAQFTASYDEFQAKNFETIASVFPTHIFTYEEASRPENDTDLNDWLMLLKHFYHHTICGRLFQNDEQCQRQYDSDLGMAGKRVREHLASKIRAKMKKHDTAADDNDILEDEEEGNDDSDIEGELKAEYLENQVKTALPRKVQLSTWQKCPCYCTELCRNKPKSSIVSKISTRLFELDKPVVLILDDALTFGLNAKNFNTFISKFMFNQRRHLGISLIFIAQTFIKTVRNSPRIFESCDVKVITPAQYTQVEELLRRDNYTPATIKEFKPALQTHYFIVPSTGVQDFFLTTLLK
jgi:hypothetical protein